MAWQEPAKTSKRKPNILTTSENSQMCTCMAPKGISKGTTVSLGWQLQSHKMKDCYFWLKGFVESRLGNILLIYWRQSFLVIVFILLTITCAGSEVQMPPFGDPDCTVVPLPSWGGSKAGSQENSHTVVFHPYPKDTKITLLSSSWCLSSKAKLGKATPPQASFPLLTGALLTQTTHHSLGQNWSQRQKHTNNPRLRLCGGKCRFEIIVCLQFQRRVIHCKPLVDSLIDAMTRSPDHVVCIHEMSSQIFRRFLSILNKQKNIWNFF